MKRINNLPKLLVQAAFCLCFGLSANAQTGVFQQENTQHNNEFFVSEFVHIQEGANVYVLGDVVIGDNSAILENEGKLQVHGNFILAPGAIMKSTNGKLVMRNNYANQNSPQFLQGNFTGINAIPTLVINSNNENGVVYLKNGNLQIVKRLRFRNGRLRTGPTGYDSGADYPFQVSILSDKPNAIAGHSVGSSITNYIEGKLQREVDLGRYFFPVGPQPSQGEGVEPFEMYFTAAPPSNILGYYDNGTSTPIGSIVNCVFDEADPIEPDDDDDDDDDDQGEDEDGSQNDFTPTQYVVDCVAGQWVIEGSSLVYFYDIQFFPSQRVLGQCNFQSYFMAKNGFIENICPINEFALYDQKFLGYFDIPGKAGPGFNGDEDLAYLTSSAGNIPVTANKIENDDAGKVANQSVINDERFLQLDIFPNPVLIEDGRVSFEVEKEGELAISLYDNLGILIAFKKLDALPGINTIGLLPKTITPGIYHVVVQDASKSYRGRLAVAR